MNLANKITISRILLIPIFVLLILFRQPTTQFFALAVFLLAALTDSIDGYVARKYEMVSDFGKFMDPLADKLLVTAALTAIVDLHRTSAWVMFIIVAREFAVTGLRLIAVSRGVVISAGLWGKIKTVVQMIAVSVALLPYNFNNICIYRFGLIDILMAIAVAITVISGLEYIIANRKLLK